MLTEIKRETRLKKRQINLWNLEQNNRTFEKEVRREEKKKKGKEVSWRSHRRRHKQVEDSPKGTYLIKRETGRMNMRNSYRLVALTVALARLSCRNLRNFSNSSN